MSTRRSKPGGFCNPKLLPKGPGGRALCRWCQQEVSGRRQSFCSDACVHEWKVRTNPGYAREHVWKRDRGVCALCPSGTPPWPNWQWEMDHTVPVVEGGGECGLENLRTLCLEHHRKVTNELRMRLAAKLPNGVIYRIWLEERQACYIGSTRNRMQRWKTHRRDLNANKHANSRLQNAWNKYGSAAFKFEILFQGIESGRLHIREDEEIGKAKIAGFTIYNLRPSAASNTGYKHSAETCAKQSAIRLGKPGVKGYRMSAETKAKLSALAKNRPLDWDKLRRMQQSNIGRQLSEAHRVKISAKLTGRAVPDSYRSKMIAMNEGRKRLGLPGPNAGRTFGPEVRAKVSAAAKLRIPYERTPENRAATSRRTIARYVEKLRATLPTGRKRRRL